MKETTTSNTEWIRSAAQTLSVWLRANIPTWAPPPADTSQIGRIYGSIVKWIVYERLEEDRWQEDWFVVGVTAYTLIALEEDGHIRLLIDEDEKLHVRVADGTIHSLSDFVAGESLPYLKYDPEFADLSWDPVNAMGHLLGEYEPPPG